MRSVFNSRQSTDKQVDITGDFTVLFTGSFAQILWSLRSSLPIQPSFGPHAVRYVSYQSLSRSSLRFIPYTWSENRAHGRCDRSTGNAYSSKAPDPTSGISRGPCLPILWFVFPTGLMRLFIPFHSKHRGSCLKRFVSNKNLTFCIKQALISWHSGTLYFVKVLIENFLLIIWSCH
jgi:hypothetical protein